MRNHKLFWGSSYDRGLDILLDLWPKVIEKFPDAELHICYGWNLFIKGYRDNPERMKWMDKMTKKMRLKGIHHYGRVNKAILKQIRSKCGIWAYPTSFTEINCITALESQYDGLVPVTMSLAALKETVGSGTKVEGDIFDYGIKEKWLEELFRYMSDEELWKKESEKAHEFAKDYGWDKISDLWLKEI